MKHKNFIPEVNTKMVTLEMIICELSYITGFANMLISQTIAPWTNRFFFIVDRESFLLIWQTKIGRTKFFQIKKKCF